MNRKWDIEDAELNKKCIEEIIARIHEADSPDEIGMIAAQEILDSVKENLAPIFYNKGVDDARKVIQNKLEDTDIDLYALIQQ